MTTILAARKAAFIFDYLRDRHCEITQSWDDGAEFVDKFLAAFPDRNGLRNDAALGRAQQRLYRACKELYEDGWLERWVLANDELSDPWHDPRWQHVYDLAHHAKRALKDRGETHWTLAARWSGVAADRIEDAAILADGNAWYSEGQLEEMGHRHDLP